MGFTLSVQHTISISGIETARSLALQLVAAVAYLIAGPLAEQIFEPAMMPSGELAAVFSFFGSGKGAGMAVLYTLSALCMFLVGLWGFSCRSLRNLDILPDRDLDVQA